MATPQAFSSSFTHLDPSCIVWLAVSYADARLFDIASRNATRVSAVGALQESRGMQLRQ